MVDKTGFVLIYDAVYPNLEFLLPDVEDFWLLHDGEDLDFLLPVGEDLDFLLPVGEDLDHLSRLSWLYGGGRMYLVDKTGFVLISDAVYPNLNDDLDHLSRHMMHLV